MGDAVMTTYIAQSRYNYRVQHTSTALPLTRDEASGIGHMAPGPDEKGRQQKRNRQRPCGAGFDWKAQKSQNTEQTPKVESRVGEGVQRSKETGEPVTKQKNRRAGGWSAAAASIVRDRRAKRSRRWAERKDRAE
ncbi:uncharacterized protein SPSK_10662 [Sporothrix schenckii 1099-18]|uniref:Uncharacterized protein n=1 Tax=Sporothrix schenckii 1099-18 TaxID=1397361 RepID=A0A0F2LYA7_SPOSC|nr:uncharacterized protein SPSK_10662 [Sporothrix schenckii 1099-18]KJR80896.1 hypothetical protein SPSK_10662 [Sporothrix schenckii 1099-18]